jgi:hypothetical protein
MRESIDLAVSGVGADLLQIEISKKHGDLEKYVATLLYKYNSDPLVDDLKEMALFVEPEDRQLGIDENLPAANMFFMGTMLGIRIASHFLPPGIQERMKDVEIYTPQAPSDDPYQNKHDIAVGIIDTGTFGFNCAEAYHPFFEEWEDRLCPDIKLQPYLRAGFGVIMHMIKEADKADMAGALESDWESELASILNSQ